MHPLPGSFNFHFHSNSNAFHSFLIHYMYINIFVYIHIYTQIYIYICIYKKNPKYLEGPCLCMQFLSSHCFLNPRIRFCTADIAPKSLLSRSVIPLTVGYPVVESSHLLAEGKCLTVITFLVYFLPLAFL
jgi:hypothetical protein